MKALIDIHAVASQERGSNGNRRFWVLRCSQTHNLNAWDIDETTRNQIWAEAVRIYEDGEPLFLTPEMEREMNAVQEDYNELSEDPRVGIIGQYLDTPLPSDRGSRNKGQRAAFFSRGDDPLAKQGVCQRRDVCVAEVQNECLALAAYRNTSARDIGAILLRLGWVKSAKTKRFKAYGKQRFYTRS